MRQPNVRSGVIGGVVTSVVCALMLASRSADPMTTFVSVLAFALAGVTLAIVLVLAVSRPPKPPIRW